MPYDPRRLSSNHKANVVVQENGCWQLTKHSTKTYPSLTWNGRVEKAHRVSFMTYKGPISEGLVVHHECNNRWCVNPDHLHAVTQKENVNFGERANVQACLRGHPFSSANTYYDPQTGRRSCKACRKVAFQAWKDRHAHAG